MTTKNLIKHDPPKMLSMREARMAGATANRLLSLRGALRQGLESGSVTLKTSNGTQSITLPRNDLMAVVGLLVERDEHFLIGLNVEISE
jgi:hypothetical protein